ncbi:MAG TPA: uroporphyrinogen-III synthase, partial [Thermoplasmata archaeon]|nr:uroporphyrinogen-III synthase [Thermoplasmata archaeon]
QRIQVLPSAFSGVDGRARRIVGSRIVYARSDRAGPKLAQALRRHGKSVLDLPVYRVVQRPSRVLRLPVHPAAVVVLSPSAWSSLSPVTRAWARSLSRFPVPFMTLGPKTADFLRRQGIGPVSHPPRPSAQSFTTHLLQRVRLAAH